MDRDGIRAAAAMNPLVFDGTVTVSEVSLWRWKEQVVF
jgi:hypothetical protein